jgi:hypothetical protein
VVPALRRAASAPAWGASMKRLLIGGLAALTRCSAYSRESVPSRSGRPAVGCTHTGGSAAPALRHARADRPGSRVARAPRLLGRSSTIPGRRVRTLRGAWGHSA